MVVWGFGWCVLWWVCLGGFLETVKGYQLFVYTVEMGYSQFLASSLRSHVN